MKICCFFILLLVTVISFAEDLKQSVKPIFMPNGEFAFTVELNEEVYPQGLEYRKVLAQAQSKSSAEVGVAKLFEAIPKLDAAQLSSLFCQGDQPDLSTERLEMGAKFFAAWPERFFESAWLFGDLKQINLRLQAATGATLKWPFQLYKRNGQYCFLSKQDPAYNDTVLLFLTLLGQTKSQLSANTTGRFNYSIVLHPPDATTEGKQDKLIVHVNAQFYNHGKKDAAADFFCTASRITLHGSDEEFLSLCHEGEPLHFYRAPTQPVISKKLLQEDPVALNGFRGTCQSLLTDSFTQVCSINLESYAMHYFLPSSDPKNLRGIIFARKANAYSLTQDYPAYIENFFNSKSVKEALLRSWEAEGK